MHHYSEDSLVEQPAIELFKELGWEAANCYQETFGTKGLLGRETAAEVVLTSRLRPALVKLNPDLPLEAIESAIEQLTRDRSAMSAVQANREIYRLVKNGVRVDLSRSQVSYAPLPSSLPEGEGAKKSRLLALE